MPNPRHYRYEGKKMTSLLFKKVFGCHLKYLTSFTSFETIGEVMPNNNSCLFVVAQQTLKILCLSIAQSKFEQFWFMIRSIIARTTLCYLSRPNYNNSFSITASVFFFN